MGKTRESNATEPVVGSQEYGGDKRRVRKTHLVETTTGDDAEREGEQRVVLSQEMGGTSVESGGGSAKTDGSTGLVDAGALGELADHEEEEGEIEEEEGDHEGDVSPQGSQAERSGDPIRRGSKN